MLLLDDAIALHLDVLEHERGASPRTLESYGIAERRFSDYLSTRLSRPALLRDVNETSFRAFLQWLRDEHTSPRWGGTAVGHSASGVRYYATVVKVLTSFLVKRRQIKRDPLAQVTLPVAPKKVQPSLSYEQVQLLADLARLTQEWRRNEALVWMLFETGTRISELCGLELADVELAGHGHETGRAKVNGKGSQERFVTFGQDTSQLVRDYCKLERPKGDSQLLFLTRDGQPMSQKTVGAVLADLATRAGVKQRVTPHVLRRAMAREYLNQHPGAVEDLRILMGHSDISQTLAYARHQRTEAALNVKSLVDTRRGLEGRRGRAPRPSEPDRRRLRIAQ